MKFTTEQLQAYAGNARNEFTTLEMQLAQELLATSDKDSTRLEWLMPKIPGRVWRTMGVIYSSNCDRPAIDRAMADSANNPEPTLCKPPSPK